MPRLQENRLEASLASHSELPLLRLELKMSATDLTTLNGGVMITRWSKPSIFPSLDSSRLGIFLCL